MRDLDGSNVRTERLLYIWPCGTFLEDMLKQDATAFWKQCSNSKLIAFSAHARTSVRNHAQIERLLL